MEVALLSEDLFKQNSPVRDDTIIKEFVPYILLAQKIYIEKMLGIPLYEELQEQVKEADANPDADPYPITPENKALLTKIAPALSLYAVYMGLPYQWAQIVNKGVIKHTSENGQSVDTEDLGMLRRILRDDANILLERCGKYMRNCGKYPLWAPEEGCCCAPKQTSPQTTGMWIPKRRRK